MRNSSSKNRIEVSLQRIGTTGSCPSCGRKRQKVIEEYFRTVRDLVQSVYKSFCRLYCYSLPKNVVERCCQNYENQLENSEVNR